MKRALQVLFPYAVFLLLALVSWNRWIQPYVDSGRELMVPRRIAQGERLYRDVQFFHGPLAPYAGAAIERAAPGSLGARIAFAALLALWNLEALRRLAARLASPGRAALATSLAVALAYFIQPGGWLFPFSFDTAAAVAAVTSALVFASGESPRDGWAGFCLLVALLSRPEIGLAAMAALLFEAGWRPRRWPSLAILPLAASAVVYAAVSLRTPVARLVSGGWLALVHPPAEFQNVYRVYAGLDRPGFRVVELALVAMALVLLGALLAAASAVSRSLPPRSRSRAAITAATMALLGAIALAAWRPPASWSPTLSLLPPFVRIVPPVLALAALARLLKRLRRRPPTGIFEGVPDSVLFLAALLGARVLLAAGYAGPYNAFFLPLPVVVTCGALWRAAEKARDSVGPVSPALATGSLAVLLGFRVLVLADVYRRPGWTNVATPAGSVRLAEPVAWTTSLALQDLAGRNLPRRTLAGFPEGGFFHYVLNLKNPLPADQFFPGRFDRAGEEEIVRRLESDPPDAVVLVNVLAVGEGATAFGKDYNVELGAAIERDFRVARAFGPGARPGARIGDPGFFIEVRVPAGGRP
ncbi:MAG TPA: hypothetical protein VKG01_19925 [Thermoanaerobaculia bacterium]|nr:hypothetical protein [Thermoanaerobaculia bacterium]